MIGHAVYGTPLAPQSPAEIQDEIIDCLSDQKGALKQCATISRQWTARAQKHLFHTIIIKDATCYARFKTMLKKHPRLAKLVQDLAVEDVSWKFSSKRQRRWLRMLLKLDHLVILTLGDVPVSLPAKIKDRLPPLFCLSRSYDS